MSDGGASAIRIHRLNAVAPSFLGEVVIKHPQIPRESRSLAAAGRVGDSESRRDLLVIIREDCAGLAPLPEHDGKEGLAAWLWSGSV